MKIELERDEITLLLGGLADNVRERLQRAAAIDDPRMWQERKKVMAEAKRFLRLKLSIAKKTTRPERMVCVPAGTEAR